MQYFFFYIRSHINVEISICVIRGLVDIKKIETQVPSILNMWHIFLDGIRTQNFISFFLIINFIYDNY